MAYTGAERRGGPAVATLAGLRAPRKGENLEACPPGPRAPSGRRPLDRPWYETLQALLAAWHAK
eukprot:10630292-Lingulodinium_polyedra.AAC.1